VAIPVAELEKRIPLAAQTSYCAELEELQELLHFPEEVALRLADTEYQLFYQVTSQNNPTRNWTVFVAAKTVNVVSKGK
jgi:hypothetical protein